MKPRAPRRASPRRWGLSLLEVMLAITILGGALVVMSELVRIGSRSSREARELTAAQLLCEAKMSEVALGFTSNQAATQQPCETDPNWVYSVQTQPSDLEGLLVVMVQVSEAQPVGPRPLQFTLYRLMVDPSVENGSSTTGTTGTTGIGTSGTGGSGSGATGSPSGSGAATSGT